MTTKEQERKALEQIRKIVEGLGEDSYIGIAFEGCFEKAAENIDNDWACSWKQVAECELNARCEAQRREKEARADYEELKNELEALRMINSKNNAELGLAKDTIQQEVHRASEWNEAYNRAVDQTYKDAEKIEELEQEIMKLKAKLYDLIVKE